MHALGFGHDVSAVATMHLKHTREDALLRRSLGVKLGLVVNGLRRRAPVVIVKFSMIRGSEPPQAYPTSWSLRGLT